MTTTPLPAPDNEERLAEQALGLDDNPHIDTLLPRPTARDHKRFKALLRQTPALAQSMTVEAYKAQRIDEQIYQTVESFMKAGTGLLRQLAGDLLFSLTIEEVRATPSVFLRQILDSAQSKELTDRLLKALKWYGARPGEQTPRIHAPPTVVQSDLRLPTQAAARRAASSFWFLLAGYGALGQKLSDPVAGF